MQKFDNKFRYERKFIINYFHEYNIYNFLKFSNYQFYEVYDPRYVNNIYFDTYSLKYYRENISGIANRKKIRIRWSGNDIESKTDKVLEIKIKNGYVGDKINFKLGKLNLKKIIKQKAIKKNLEVLGLPQDICSIFSFIDPKLINQYKRSEFLSKNGKIRITIDNKIKYTPVSAYLNENNKKFIKSFDYVMEVKYPVKNDFNVRDVTNIFPQRLSRNSKYVNGIDLLKEKYIFQN